MYDKIIKKIKTYNYVSFDLFDTLLKRNIRKPTDLFIILEKIGRDKYGRIFDGFKEKRIEAEYQAREDIQGEVQLVDIYRYFIDLPEKVIPWTIQTEEKLEYKYCTINQNIKPVYDYCLRNNKRIEIISDMYLPESLIKKMLDKIGICQWDNLYLSNTVGKTKSGKGTIFRYVLKKLKIKPGELIHIGDNRINDINNAKKYGINTIYIPTHINNLKYYDRPVNNIWDNIAREFINNNIINVNKNQKLGFETMGPLLYGFCLWLINELKRRNIHKVYFLSRDGQIIKKAFDIINHNKKLKTYYFYASRRAFQVPILAYESVNYKQFLKRLKWPDRFDFRYFLKSLGIENIKIQEKLAKKHAIKLDQVFLSNNLKENVTLKNFFDKERNLIRRNAKQEKDCLVGYIKQSHMEGDIAIVDIGWIGNMQRNLEFLIKKEHLNIKIGGYYVGINPYENYSRQLNMSGYLFAQEYNLTIYNRLLKIFNLFEQIFMADHGSVRRLIFKDNKYIPELYPFEQKNLKNASVLLKYQEGALLFIKKFYDQFGLSNISVDFAFSGVWKQFTDPKYDDAKTWGNLVYKNVKENRIIMGNNYSIFLHPLRFKKDYTDSIWKEGYLCIHIKKKINYLWIVDHLHKPIFLRRK